MYGIPCPDCGANLDPGEKCDCKDEKVEQKNIFQKDKIFRPKEYRGEENVKRTV